MTEHDALMVLPDHEGGVPVAYPELGADRSAWRERTLLFRSYLAIRDRLRYEHPYSWVALLRGERLLVSDDLDELRATVAGLGYDPRAALIKYVTPSSLDGEALRGAARSFGRAVRGG